MDHQKNTTFSSFSILIVFLLLSIVGVSLIPGLSVQLIPSRSYASAGVSCYMGQASAQVTELELTKPIESTLARLKGVKKLSSYSGEGYASVRIELDKWTNPEMFRFEVATAMRELYKKLPKNAGYPQVFLNRPDDHGLGGPVLGYTLNGPGTANEIANIAENQVRPALAALKGIYRLDIQGSVSQRTLVSTSTDRLLAAGLGYVDLSLALSLGAQSSDLGVLKTAGGNLHLFLENALNNSTSLLAYPLTRKNNRIIRVADLAQVKTENVPISSYYRINGQSLVSFSIHPEANVNIVQLAAKVRETLRQTEKLLPNGYRLALSFDKTTYIKEELNRVYFRTFLSIGILFLFVILITRQLYYLLIVLIALVVNVLLSFILYYFLGLKIHLYSLAGITISVGMIIDNVIVVIEDIRHTGKNRIFAAILASTLTALGALSVIFLLEESQRINLLDFAMSIILNLLVSLPVAYFFIPALMEKIPVNIKSRQVLFWRRRFLVRFNNLYTKQLGFMLRHRILFLLVFMLLFGLPLFMLPDKFQDEKWVAKIYNKTIGTDFYKRNLKEPINRYLGGALYLFISNQETASSSGLESEENVQLFVNISMPNGATLDQMDAVVQGFETYLTRFGRQLEVFTASVQDPTWAVISIYFKKAYRTGFPFQLKRLLETQAIYAGSADFQIYGVGRGFSNAIELNEYNSSITLRGYNYEQLNQQALRIRDTLLRYPRVQDVLITSEGRYNQKLNYEYVVNFKDPGYLALHTAGRYAVGNALHVHETNSQPVGILLTGGNEAYKRLDVALNPESPPGIWSLLHQEIPLNKQGYLRLEELSDIEQMKKSGGIRRENQQYVLNIHYRFIGTYMLNNVIRDHIIKNVQKKLPIGYAIYNPDDNHWGWGNDGNYQYIWFIVLVLFIIYVICAVLLESFLQPLAVIVIIPFSFIGVFLIFYMLDLSFDQGGYASLLMLAGLVTNAALYIINDLNFLRKQRKFRQTNNTEVYIRAFNAKAMPIVVTTASAVLSLLPFLISGEEKGFWFTLSSGTIGGLLFSLLGVWLLLPLCMVENKKRKYDPVSDK